MKYVLSDNSITTDQIKYISDVIKLNMTVNKNQVPYFTGGTDKLLTPVTKDDILNNVKQMISDIVSRISNLISNIPVSIVKVEFVNSNIVAVINISKSQFTYDIPTTII